MSGSVKPRHGLTRRRLLLAGAVLAAPPTATLAYAGGIEPYELKVTNYQPHLPRWPADHRLTIGVIADLHAGGPNMGLARVRAVVDRMNALAPDLVVLLGDFFATHKFITEHVSGPAWAGALARLQARLGVWSILGNHDWWHDIAGVRAALAAVGIPILENDATLLTDGPRRFWLAGIGDQIAYRLGRGRFQGVDDLPGTLAKLTTDDAAILLVHEPDIFAEVPDRIALTLAGHTHGGQVRVPLLWPHIVPSAYGARYAYGHVIEDGRHLIVSGGLGTSALPIRLGVPPEILHITLGG